MNKMSLNEKIENYLQERDFVTVEDLEKIGREFMTDQEFQNIIKKISQHNDKSYEELKKKLKKYQQILQEQQTTVNNNPLKEVKPKKKEEIQTEKTSNFYKNLLYTKENIEYFLPKPNAVHFNYIMNLLIKEVLKEIMEWQNIISKDLSEQEITEYTEEIEAKKSLLNRLIQYRDQKIDINEEEQQLENKLVYLSSTSDGYYVLSDMKKLELEYYASFLELLKSIKNGTFKNFKPFTNNNKLNGIYEVKDFKTRIVFKRLKEDIYIILAMFIKKTDNDLAYRTYLQNRVAIFQANQEKILANILDENFMQEQHLLTENVELTLTRGDERNE